jgi:hypothetical protein
MTEDISPDYFALYRSLLRDVAAVNGSDNTDLCLFAPCVHEPQSEKVLVIGRAVNSWGDAPFSAAGMGNGTDNPDSVIRTAFRESGWDVDHQAVCGGSLAWVLERWSISKGYRTGSSAFWRVAKRIAEGLFLPAEEADWINHIAWSNLYKIAPASGGNPGGALWRSQVPLSPELIASELEILSPKAVVILAGFDWFSDFAPRVATELHIAPSTSIVEVFGYLNGGIPFVVSPHPQGKGETRITNEVLSRLNELAG